MPWEMVSFVPASWRQTFPYGTIPRVATADGRDRIPSEMFSATITRWTVLERGCYWLGLMMGSHAFQLACIKVRTLLFGATNTVNRVRYWPPWHDTILHFPRFFVSKGIVCRLYRIGLLLHVGWLIVYFVVLNRTRCFRDAHIVE